MMDYTHGYFKPFDHITGSNQGTYTDAEMALDIIDNLKEYSNNSIDQSDSVMESVLTDAYRNLAMDLINEDDVDLDHYTETLADNANMPDYCSLVWNDDELRIVPCLDLVHADNIVTGDETPFDDDLQIDENPNNDDFYLVVNDHGNSTLCWWSQGDKQWQEVWSIV